MVKKIILSFLCLAIVCLGAFFVYGNFYAGALLSNGSACTDNNQCQSGNCAARTVCCSVNQCGWAAEDGNPIMCISNNHYKSNQYLNGVCRNGVLMTVPGGWGCGAWPCDSGICSGNNCSGSVPNGAPRGSSTCASGYVNNTWCCSSGQCGGVADPWCFYSGQNASNLWFNGVCRGGAWKTVTGGIGCDPNGINFACDVPTDQCINNTCVSTLLPDGSNCASGSQCVSGYCNCGYCVPGSGYCGSGVTPYYAANGGMVNYGNNYFNGICDNGSWRITANGYGCTVSNSLCSPATFACVSGYTCDTGVANGRCVSNCTPNVAKGCYNNSIYWYDSCGARGDLYASCASGQTCSSTSFTCVSGCTLNSAKACYNNSVYWYDSCNNRGEIYDACDSNETCSGGACVAGSCTANYSKACSNNSVYWYDSCNNRGEIYDTCDSNETCSNGACAASSSGCIAYSSKKCDSGNVYWYDSCGVRGDLYQNCGNNTLTASYRCSGNWLQQSVITKDCISGACTQTPAWNNVQDCAAGGKICKNGVCVSGDTAAPAISGLAPAGTVGNPVAVLTATTNEAADCRYSFWYDKSFDQMISFFKTSTKLYHSASISLPNHGSYVYYVRCKDAAGNVNLTSAKISFNYPAPATTAPAVPTTPKETAPADKIAPVISDIAPFGTINTATTTISCVTDEKATCKYDIADTDYDSMENKMDSQNGTRQSKDTVLSNAGSYAYYVRCKDAAGNKNTRSAQISFTYAPPQIPGPAITGAQPGGTVYQKSIALTLTTDKTSECRWSNTDQDFDAMPGLFSTADGQSQQATVELNDFGQYVYYVRCKDQSGNKTGASSVIGFEYKNPNANPVPETVTPGQQQSVVCDKPVTGESDGTCDAATDCICDPDCLAGGDGADVDCAGLQSASNTGGNFLIIVVPVVLIVIAAFTLFLFLRKRGRGEEREAY